MLGETVAQKQTQAANIFNKYARVNLNKLCLFLFFPKKYIKTSDLARIVLSIPICFNAIYNISNRFITATIDIYDYSFYLLYFYFRRSSF